MTIHESSEDYLENILILSERLGRVRSIDIVNEMNYSKPSISVAMKKLREKGCIEVDREGFITLTAAGRAIAEKIYGRHRLLEKVLFSLGVDKKTASDEACRIEHDISDDTCDRIRDYYAKHMKSRA
ncbi:MAG: metal-dependent transcriptional regulator [Lachnospiraceae bacterium]|jgi:DtxR family Mn-dependent transcriptional regulator|nr:metal-dependent transcriptional regulator [Lachnospiraceae bacterium]